MGDDDPWFLRKRPYAKAVEPYEPYTKKLRPKTEVPIKGISVAGSSGLKLIGKDNLTKGYELSLLDCLHKSRQGENVNHDFSRLRKAVLIDQIDRFHVLKAVCPFYRRVTSIAWHPTNPNIVAAASKGGEIAWYNLRLQDTLSLHGIGPGGSIVGMKIDRDIPSVVYTASIEGNVKLIDLDKQEEKILMTSKSRDEWFSSLDYCQNRKLILSGDTSGYMYVINPQECNVNSVDACHTRNRFHKSKVTHVEFCPRDPNIIVSCSIDHIVKLWDFRMLRGNNLVEPLHVLPHKKGVNSAYFSPSDRFSLLTTDQHSEIRIYRSPIWDDELVIKHPHRQFQHLTPIKATWHPLEDLFIVGRYPDDTIEINDKRTLDIFDGKSGKRLHKIQSPNKNIASLNAFNITGDALMSCSGSTVMIWKDEDVLPMFQ